MNKFNRILNSNALMKNKFFCSPPLLVNLWMHSKTKKRISSNFNCKQNLYAVDLENATKISSLNADDWKEKKLKWNTLVIFACTHVYLLWLNVCTCKRYFSDCKYKLHIRSFLIQISTENLNLNQISCFFHFSKTLNLTVPRFFSNQRV